MNENEEITLVVNKAGCKQCVMVKRSDEVLHADVVNLNRAKDRVALIAAICEKVPAADKAEIERELLRQVDAPARGLDEVKSDDCDAIQIVRPERFILHEADGLCIPAVTIEDTRPVGKWKVYLRWADGRREARELPEYLDLADGSRVFISPMPPAPAPKTMAGWSARSRREWLAGAPVPNVAAVFKDMLERIVHFLELPPDHAHGASIMLGAWTLLTYCYPAFDAVPYVYVGGPLGSGKSRAFEVLQRLTFRPLPSSSLTAAALFRTLHNRGGTLLLDEAERLRESTPDVSDLLSMLLAGYKRGGRATRLEPDGDGKFKTTEFDVYGPKALACINGLPANLASRCIPLTMFRAAPESPKPRRRIDADPACWEGIRDALHVLALEHGATWLSLPGRADVCPQMTGRQYELWQPLLALAEWIELQDTTGELRGLLHVLQNYAQSVNEASRDDQTPEADELLLRVLARKINDGDCPRSSDVLEQARTEEPNLFKSWTAAAVGKHLRRYGIETQHSGDRRFRDLTMNKLWEVQRRYGVDLGLAKPSSPSKPSKSLEMGAELTAGKLARVDRTDGLDGK